jgi:hypothetical protein
MGAMAGRSTCSSTAARAATAATGDDLGASTTTRISTTPSRWGTHRRIEASTGGRASASIYLLLDGWWHGHGRAWGIPADLQDRHENFAVEAGVVTSLLPTGASGRGL